MTASRSAKLPKFSIAFWAFADHDKIGRAGGGTHQPPSSIVKHDAGAIYGQHRVDAASGKGFAVGSFVLDAGEDTVKHVIFIGVRQYGDIVGEA